MSRRPWPPEEDKILSTMLPGGATFREVGDRIGRTISSVASRAHRLGIKQPEEMRKPKRRDDRAKRLAAWTPEEAEATLKAYWSGTTASELAEQHGMSVEALKGRLKRMGAKKRGNVEAVQIKPSRQDEVAEMISRGMTFEQVADQLFITVNAVEKAFKRIRRNLGDQAR